MKKLEKYFLFWLPPIAWMAIIFILSSFHKLQASPVSWQDFLVRKTIHFLEYLILFLLFYRGLRNTSCFSKKKMVGYSLFLAIIYAISDEYHQTFVSGRSGKIFDIGVDSAGSLFGAILILRLKPYLPPKLIKILERLRII